MFVCTYTYICMHMYNLFATVPISHSKVECRRKLHKNITNTK